LKVWKLLTAIVVIIGLAIASPYALAWCGLIAPIKDYAWSVMTVVTVGLALKIVFGDLVSGQFLYYKHGYDMCMMTFGASLSNVSLQLLADHDLFPGISTSGPLSAFLIGPDHVSQKRNMLLILFILTILGVALTAYIARAITEPDTKGKDFLSLLNFALGSGFLGIYVLTIITKG
jgi:hypothetical protein